MERERERVRESEREASVACYHGSPEGHARPALPKNHGEESGQRRLAGQVGGADRQLLKRMTGDTTIDRRGRSHQKCVVLQRWKRRESDLVRARSSSPSALQHLMVQPLVGAEGGALCAVDDRHSVQLEEGEHFEIL